jgi:pyruvate-formate lyase-activating enzyme
VTPFVQKPGQTVVVQTYQVDEKGFALSRVTAEWFGFENPEANDKSMQLVAGVQTLVKAWKEEKAAHTAPPGQAKQG